METASKTAANVEPDVDAVIAEISERGFCVVPSVISTEKTEKLNACLEVIRTLEDGQEIRKLGHQRVLHIAAKNAMFLEPLLHPFVLKVWRKYLGEDMICSTWSANTLYPHSNHMYWHADHPYWTITTPYPTFPLCGQTIWMLDDFTAENGATAGIPGSHRRPYLPDLGHGWSDEAEVLTGTRGSVIMADGAWWHTSTANRTDRPRSALLATYIRSFCVPQEDMRSQLACLKDPSDEIKQLFGSNQYQSQKTFPY
jgi:ectoine hydroxylase-related dioxygenase (phytanoyl-CoA dioxygenase family)